MLLALSLVFLCMSMVMEMRTEMQINDVLCQPREAYSDEWLVQQTLAGNNDAFTMLVHRYRPWLLPFICHLTHNVTESEDIVQQVFLKLYLALSTLRTDQPLKSWLFQVARNRCYDEVRRKHAFHFSELEEGREDGEFSELAQLLDTQPSPQDIAELHDLQSAVQQAISALPQKVRAIVLLRYEGQLTFSEIAQILDIPEQTAKTYMHRAKPLLRKALIPLREPAVSVQ